MSDQQQPYYLPEPSHWPIIGSIALFTIMAGAANWLHHATLGPYFFLLGMCLLFYMIYGWFSTVIREDRAGLLASEKMDTSYRWSMVWFIFSEVCFFSVFFGTLFYARELSVPWLGGSGHGEMTHYLLWPDFKALWPLMKNPDNTTFVGPHGIMDPWGIPALNTLILLSSGATITWAHWGLLNGSRKAALIGQALTILLGITFLALQVQEYSHAYEHLGLTLNSGIYGSTFFILTGFHGFHVTLGTLMLIVIFFRIFRGDFNTEHHFAFEAVSWYWHFVDVVWLGLFVFVYWL